jgi:hypothetical protein
MIIRQLGKTAVPQAPGQPVLAGMSAHVLRRHKGSADQAATRVREDARHLGSARRWRIALHEYAYPHRTDTARSCRVQRANSGGMGPTRLGRCHRYNDEASGDGVPKRVMP